MIGYLCLSAGFLLIIIGVCAAFSSSIMALNERLDAVAMIAGGAEDLHYIRYDCEGGHNRATISELMLIILNKLNVDIDDTPQVPKKTILVDRKKKRVNK